MPGIYIDSLLPPAHAEVTKPNWYTLIPLQLFNTVAGRVDAFAAGFQQWEHWYTDPYYHIVFPLAGDVAQGQIEQKRFYFQFKKNRYREEDQARAHPFVHTLIRCVREGPHSPNVREIPEILPPEER